MVVQHANDLVFHPARRKCLTSLFKIFQDPRCLLYRMIHTDNVMLWSQVYKPFSPVLHHHQNPPLVCDIFVVYREPDTFPAVRWHDGVHEQALTCATRCPNRDIATVWALSVSAPAMYNTTPRCLKQTSVIHSFYKEHVSGLISARLRAAHSTQKHLPRAPTRATSHCVLHGGTGWSSLTHLGRYK